MITAKQVSEKSLLEFLQKHFAIGVAAISHNLDLTDFMQQHSCADMPSMSVDLIFAYLSRTPERSGRHSTCHFYELSNGGFYMAPQTDTLSLLNETLSGDAAGIIATVCALANCIQKRIDIADQILTDEDERLYSQYYALRDFAKEHAESSIILQAIR